MAVHRYMSLQERFDAQWIGEPNSARAFGVARSLISRIRQRKSWRHVP